MIGKSVSMSNNEKLSFISNMATMYNAGIPILETIESMSEDSKGSTRKILDSIKADLIQGQSISTAFAKFPKVFDKVTVSVVKASEEAGTLDVVLKDIKIQIQKDMEFMDNVKGALTYPIIILILFLLVLIMILVVVVPKIASVFISLKVALPLPTKIMIFFSNLIIHNTLLLTVGLVAFFALVIFTYKAKKQIVLNILFSFPLISTLIREIDMARFARSMYLLLTSGITITNALSLAKDIVLKKDVAEVIAYAEQTILAGKKLSDGFKDRKSLFPSIVIKIIEAGEKTGTLDKSMEEISNYMDYQVSSTLKKVVSLLEPLMLMFVGGLVGGMMFSIIAPIYGLISQVGNGAR